MAVDPAVQDSAVPSLAVRLRTVQVGVREDLDVSRHLFRGVVSYVVRDPITFHSQRFDLADYEILAHIRSDRSLGEIFDTLVKIDRVRESDEERFYQFVLSLHRLSFLRLPVSDDKLLYRRYRLKQQMRGRETARSLLFLRVPLWNPSRFLDRTIHLVAPLFTRTAFLIWLVLVISAGFVVARNWSDLANPLQGLLVANNLPLIWVTLIVLKVFHEFGHAYACRHYGGHVPEMGAFFILFTPCAYMDATDSWRFPNKRERIAVCLAGMYVEVAIAAVAVFVWAMTGPSQINALAYNVIFLAGAVTILCNVNPLMRYDGYYVLSDFVEVPNLRQRATRYAISLLKRWALGIDDGSRPDDRRLRLILLTYGVSAALYRVMLMIAIAAILASRMFMLGLVVGVLFILAAVFKTGLKLTNYLWYADETAGRRVRAAAWSIVALLLLPLGVMWVPLPSTVDAAALVHRENETVVRDVLPGFVESVSVRCGEFVDEGASLALLSNDAQLERVLEARERVRAAEIRRDAYRPSDPARALQEATAVEAAQRNLDSEQARLALLDVRAPVAGQVIDCIRERDVGSFLGEGRAVATIVSGAWYVRALLTDEQITAARPRVGDRVRFRAASSPGTTLVGVVVRTGPLGDRRIDDSALTHSGGGEIVVDSVTGAAAQPYFEVTAELLGDVDAFVRSGMTGVIRLTGETEPIGRKLTRRIARFWNRLLEG